MTKRQERYQRQAKYSQAEETQKELDKIDRQYKSKKSQLDEMKRFTGTMSAETKPQILDIEWHVDSKCIVRIT